MLEPTTQYTTLPVHCNICNAVTLCRQMFNCGHYGICETCSVRYQTLHNKFMCIYCKAFAEIVPLQTFFQNITSLNQVFAMLNLRNSASHITQVSYLMMQPNYNSNVYCFQCFRHNKNIITISCKHLGWCQSCSLEIPPDVIYVCPYCNKRRVIVTNLNPSIANNEYFSDIGPTEAHSSSMLQKSSAIKNVQGQCSTTLEGSFATAPSITNQESVQNWLNKSTNPAVYNGSQNQSVKSIDDEIESIFNSTSVMSQSNLESDSLPASEVTKPDSFKTSGNTDVLQKIYSIINEIDSNVESRSKKQASEPSTVNTDQSDSSFLDDKILTIIKSHLINISKQITEVFDNDQPLDVQSGNGEDNKEEENNEQVEEENNGYVKKENNGHVKEEDNRHVEEENNGHVEEENNGHVEEENNEHVKEENVDNNLENIHTAEKSLPKDNSNDSTVHHKYRKQNMRKYFRTQSYSINKKTLRRKKKWQKRYIEHYRRHQFLIKEQRELKEKVAALEKEIDSLVNTLNGLVKNT